ncbi:MAG TPA: peptidylprolyl isomerase [Methylomirabilota bacterium]|nr:peptidylprolyl isomerase [Methylomirabilota bacterium]
MARRISLPRLTQRQRMARWQRDRRQQTIIVTIFGAILFFTIGLVVWAATDRYYSANLKPAVTIDGRAFAMRDYRRELGYVNTRFYIDYGVPPGYENDPQIATQKAGNESVALDALVEHQILDVNARADGIVVTPQQLDDRFVADFGEFHTRHVLITPKPVGDAADAAAVADTNALAKARAVVAQLSQSPNDQALWNTLATQYSDDPGSKDSGGDLGFVAKGQFVKEYEDAVHTMQVGQVSEPIKSQYGYHIIQLLELRPPSDSVFVKRAASYGYGEADIKAHVRYDILKDAYTKKAQAASVQSPTEQVHLAWIAIASPKVSGGDFQAFSDQLKKLSDVQKAIDDGKDFAAIVKQYSEDSNTTDKGGDLGWFAHGMITRLPIEKDIFALDAGKVSGQKSDSTQTVWYKVLEKDPSRALDDDQKKQIAAQAYGYFYQQQKSIHEFHKLVPGHELDT